VQERNLQTPLLIGGATTSKMHTAVKIVPQYKGAAVRCSREITLKLLSRCACACMFPQSSTPVMIEKAPGHKCSAHSDTLHEC